MSPMLARIGFDPDRFGFGMRTAVAACMALVLAWAVGLEHPQWSAMTVWAASQPVRGALIEKSAFRLLGTVIGCLFGITLMVISQGSITVLVIGIALWMGACALSGNVLRGFVSYGAMLAGYSAAMVALIDAAHPQNVWHLGLDRLLTVGLGVLTALVVGWLFASKDKETSGVLHARRLSARILHDIAGHLIGVPLDRTEKQAVLTEMALLETTLDLQSAGSIKARRTARRIRTMLAAQVAAVLWLRAHAARTDHGVLEEGLRNGLAEAIRAVETGDGGASRLLQSASSYARAHTGLPAVLDGLASSLAHPVDGSDIPGGSSFIHRDWIGGRQAMARAVVTMLAVGVVWLATEWSMGGYMMLGTAIMTSIFSTFERPVRTMRYVFIGQVLGVLGALVCRWILWPSTTGSFGMILAIVPLVLLGGLMFSHRRAIPFAFDYNMVLLLLLQPAWPSVMPLETSLLAGAAIVIGPIIGLAAFHLIYRTDSHRRRDTVRTAMVRDLEKLASGQNTLRQRQQWRSRLYHRVLLAIFWAQRSSRLAEDAADEGLAALTVGGAIQHLHELALGQQKDRLRLDAVLRRLTKLGNDPGRAARALRLVSIRLAKNADSELLQNAARELESHDEFFRLRPGANSQIPSPL